MGACTGYVRDMYGISMGQLWGKRRLTMTDNRWIEEEEREGIMDDVCMKLDHVIKYPWIRNAFTTGLIGRNYGVDMGRL